MFNNTILYFFITLVSLILFSCSVAAFNNLNVPQAPPIIRNGWLIIMIATLSIMSFGLTLFLCNFASSFCQKEQNSHLFLFVFLLLSLFLIIISGLMLSTYNKGNITYEVPDSQNKSYVNGTLACACILFVICTIGIIVKYIIPAYQKQAQAQAQAQPQSRSRSRSRPRVQPRPVGQPVAQPVPQPVPQPVAQPVPQPVAQPVAQPVPQPVPQPVEEEVKQMIPQPKPRRSGKIKDSRTFINNIARRSPSVPIDRSKSKGKSPVVYIKKGKKSGKEKKASKKMEKILKKANKK